MRAALLCCLLTACTTPQTPDAGFTPTQTRLLGLNDATFLLPLEPLDAGSAFPPAVELIAFAAFDRLTSAMPPVRTDLARLRVVAIRFDLCDRAQPGACANEADGVFRLVLQPVFGTPQRTEDIALHAFYTVPREAVPEVVDELRALATLQDVPRGAALRVNAVFATDSVYRQQLTALVTRYAKSPRLHRLTLFGQETEKAALIWIFRGEERTGTGPLAPIELPGGLGTSQEVLLFGGDSYVLTPLADVPVGFSRAVMETSFRNSTTEQQRESVRSLTAVDNPRLHTANTVQCASCHLTTTMLSARASDAGIDLTALPEFFGPAMFDATPLGTQGARFRTLRALGYFGDVPLVSARVINETIDVLGELEVRFPAAVR